MRIRLKFRLALAVASCIPLAAAQKADWQGRWD